ncbi:MAG TPA: LacI family DNA-binding transcriptional regulator, partial [Caproiciproducens sp.]|nr:LacI family DNA-binding transcriptional regulator [Caproiciproducens sp.]
MATIKEIARMAEVSTTTISNVLNGKPGAASEAKANEILALAQQLSYTPNAFAKRLKQQKSNSIGIITEDLTVFNAPEIVDGVDAYCEENGYEIILANMRLFKRYNNDFTDTPRHQSLLDALVRNLMAKQVEGLVYVGYHCREIHCLPSMLSVPLVYAYCYPKNMQYSAVLYDDEKAAYDVTCSLIKKGHRNIGVLCGPISSFHSQSRLRGVQKALFDNSVLYNAAAVLYGDWGRNSGYEAARDLKGLGCTAVFCFNDLMASGLYEWFTEQGMEIGRDISLFGFDNRDISCGYTHKIST